MYEAKLSGHASFRILFGDENGPRTVLDRYEIRRILNDPCRHILLGQRGNISYILFYSLKDEDHFVVLQDESKKGRGEVITVQPLHYYSGPFPVSDEILNKAKMIAQEPKKYIVI